MAPRYITDLAQIPGIPETERGPLEAVAQRYAFRVNDYYLGLIDWADPADPIRQLIIPHVGELEEWGTLDASNEAAHTPVKGLQHKYRDTALLLCNEVCGAYCRYCFRKRLFMNDNDEVSLDVSAGLAYIARHPEITNVLLTGGDPLLLSTRRLTEILQALREVDHVRTIRLGSKMPAFNPWRILDDVPLQQALRECSTPGKRIYLMAHFDHPRELTPSAIEGLECVMNLGVIVVNQCPLIRGVNDDAGVLHDLFQQMAWIGAPQYYLFQGRPTAGNAPFEVPIVQGFQLFEQAKQGLSGLECRARFCMSHATGKVEVVGLDQRFLYLRYHRAHRKADEGRFLVCHRDESAYWLDDLREVTWYQGVAQAHVPSRTRTPRKVRIMTA
ncbi:MAG: hypothetical protein GEEBNDBF_00748 [bacterium]|nr:hypothetical protein [bacterium]